MKVLLCFLTLIWTPLLQARVFDFSKETVAPYVSARGGTSSIGTDTYSWQTPASYSGTTASLHYGGGFGISLRGESIGLQFGILVDTLNKIEAAKGLNASGAELYSVDSEALTYGGLFAINYQFKKMKTSMWKVTVGGGYQYAKVKNTYSATADGQAAGINSVTESFLSEHPFAMASVGAEFHLSGATTLSLDLGYQYRLGNTWTYGEGGSNFAGAHNQGGNVVLENGSNKLIDWNYPYIEVTFRFYIDKVR